MKNMYDVIVVGGGPAGLTAAIYLARAKYRVLVLEKDHFGGQITITSEVVNYPGVKKTSGKELTDNMRVQAENFGAEFMLAEVESLDLDQDIKIVKTARGEFKCFGVLLATGAHPRTVGFVGEEEFKGRGVAYCATCDGEFFTGKDVFVIGGGFAAAEESVFLTKFARNVTILIREDDFTCAKTVAEHARNNPKITVLTNRIVEEVRGKNGLNYIRYKNTVTNEITEYIANDGETFGVFVFAGYQPATSLVKGIANLNEQGYVITDETQKTSVDGLYAAGDVCIKPLRQVVTAVGDGALAATELENYAAKLQEKTNIKPTFQVQQEEKNSSKQQNSIFSSDIVNQLNTVFSKMNNSLILKLHLDDKPVSNELESYIDAMSELTEKLTVEKTVKTNNTPYVSVHKNDGTFTGLAFHGVPGGHEFTSFILGLYNTAGPGQAIDDDIKNEITKITKTIDMKVLVSLSCTMCPELVIAAQRIASLNDNVIAEVYDLNHFEEIKKQYNVMSVPCLVVNNQHITFGKKNIRQLLDYLNSVTL